MPYLHAKRAGRRALEMGHPDEGPLVETLFAQGRPEAGSCPVVWFSSGWGSPRYPAGPDWSVRHGGQADERIIAECGDGFQGHVAGALHGPLVVLLQEDCPDEPGDGVLVGEMPTTSVRRLISPFTRSSGLVEWSFTRCGAGKLM